MSSVVQELQKVAMDRNTSVTDLLRKAFVIAKKLHIADFENWAEQELNGYIDVGGDEIPRYRQVVGEIRGWNEYHGWVPVIIPDPEIMGKLSKRGCNSGIAEIENLAKQYDSNKGSGIIQMNYDPHINAMLGKATGHQTEYCIMSSPGALIRILDAVRTIILNWSLKLEDDGILGENLSFTPQEKRAAENPVYHTVNNFYGNVQQQQIQQHTSSSTQSMNIKQTDLSDLKKFLERIQNQIEELNLSTETRQELEAEIKTAEIQINSPKPKHPIIRESLSAIRRILEITTGGVAARLLIDYGPVLKSWFF